MPFPTTTVNEGFETFLRSLGLVDINKPAMNETVNATEGREEKTRQYFGDLVPLANQAQAVRSEAAEPRKWDLTDYLTTAASIALPLLAMTTKRGEVGLPLMYAGKAAGAVGGLRRRRAEEARTGRLGAEAGNIESQAALLGQRYKADIGDIEAAQDIEQQQWGRGTDVAKLGLRKEELDWKMTKPGKPPFTAGQLYQQGRTAEKDRQTRVLQDADAYLKSLPFMGDIEGSIRSVEDLNSVISIMRNQAQTPMRMAPEAQNALSVLEGLLNEYYGNGGSKPPDMSDAEWQEYQQMKGM